VSLTALYNKVARTEPRVVSTLVQHTADRLAPQTSDRGLTLIAAAA